MKKIAALLILLLVFGLLPFALFATAYSDYNYYIKNFDVEIIANTDRSFDVVETITVWFFEESRGIIRDIPTFSSVEQYQIAGVYVKDDPSTITYNDSYVSVRIGDPDVYMTGEKTYVISYKRICFDDNVPEFDYLYMDIIGDGWDVPIADFSAKVTLPVNAKINKYTLTSGSYGNTENNYSTGSLNDNIIHVRMKNPLEPYMAVTLNVEMFSGAFPDAPVYVPALVIHELEIFASLNQYGMMTVSERYTATINERVSLWRNKSMYAPDLTDSYIFSNNWINTDNDLVDDDEISFGDEQIGKTISFSSYYQSHYRITDLQKNYCFCIGGFYASSDYVIENIFIDISSPFDISSYFVEDGSFNWENKEQEVSHGDKKHISFEDNSGNGFRYLTFKCNNSGFKRVPEFSDYVIPVISFIIAAIIILLAFYLPPAKPFSPPIEFYPPYGMNSAEVGFVIDNRISGRDITSLIYYWASHGHIKIEIPDKTGAYILHKLSDLDNVHQTYEVIMFNSLFLYATYGAGDVYIHSSSLENSFYRSVSSARAALRYSFRGTRSIERAPRKALAGWLCFILTFLYILITSTVINKWEKFTYLTGKGTLAVIAIFLSLILFAFSSKGFRAKYKIKNRGLRNILLLIPASLVALLLFVALAGQSLALLSSVVFILLLIASFTALPYVRRHSDFGHYLLERVVGFKMFLTTAEKSRLEMLLNENPDYYYDILPYAQVLGVSHIWEEKFDGLLSQPPSWCYGDGVDNTFSSFGALSLMDSISSNMTSSPSSDSSGSLGGGGSSFSGGGDFGGGGSSGGGGGGGGSSW